MCFSKSRLRSWGLGFGVLGLGFWVLGLGIWASRHRERGGGERETCARGSNKQETSWLSSSEAAVFGWIAHDVYQVDHLCRVWGLGFGFGV